jgi:hypothetical protein
MWPNAHDQPEKKSSPKKYEYLKGACSEKLQPEKIPA